MRRACLKRWRISVALKFDAPPTIARFMRSNSFGRLIAGPVGSGKTTGCIVELLRRSIEQEAASDGLRYTRWVVARQTLKQLKDTILKDADTWLAGNGIGEWRVSESTFIINFQDVRSELILIPLETAEDQARLLSMQITGCWLSEAIEMDISVLGPISERCGRYPSAGRGAPSWFGMIADTNMPSLGSEWHKFMTQPRSNWDIFIQPSGMAENAENLEHLLQTAQTAKLDLYHPDEAVREYNILKRREQGRKYYERLLEEHGAGSSRAKRYIYAEYGDDPEGTAVFRDSFKLSFHVVNETVLNPGYPLLIGQDFGRDPWSLICQCDHLGRLIVHEEVGAEGIGLESHVIRNLRPRLLSDRYLGFKVAMVGDPAGTGKSTITEESNFDALKRMGLPAFPAPTNDLDPRLRAVEALLLRQTNGGPTLIINGNKCPRLVEALNGGYKYGKTKAGQRKPLPNKDEFSHVADALQYVALVCFGGMIEWIASRLVVRKRQNQIRISSKGWT